MPANSTQSAAALLTRLESFQIDSGSESLSFRDRLARDNRWTADYADRAITEYKRFIYLIAISGRPQTPSDQVDQVWHLHMVYTRSYWQDLCEKVLGFPLHHSPTRGGGAEKRKFHEYYTHTLSFYEKTFGTPPPKDIWPSVADRFAEAENFTRINTADYWLLPKPRPVLGRLALTGSLAAVFLAACGDQGADDAIPLWLKLLIALPGLILLFKVLQWISSGGSGKGKGGGCSGVGCSGCGGCGGCGGG